MRNRFALSKLQCSVVVLFNLWIICLPTFGNEVLKLWQNIRNAPKAKTGFCCHCQGRLGHSTMSFPLVGSLLPLWCKLGVQWTLEGRIHGLDAVGREQFQTSWECNPLKPTLKMNFF